MKYLIILLIRIYWIVVPPSWRRDCIFQESCSCHVLRITEKQGWRKGFQALRKRIRQCRPGFVFLRLPDEQIVMLTVDGSNVPEKQIRKSLLSQQGSIYVTGE